MQSVSRNRGADTLPGESRDDDYDVAYYGQYFVSTGNFADFIFGQTISNHCPPPHPMADSVGLDHILESDETGTSALTFHRCRRWKMNGKLIPSIGLQPHNCRSQMFCFPRNWNECNERGILKIYYKRMTWNWMKLFCDGKSKKKSIFSLREPLFGSK